MLDYFQFYMLPIAIKIGMTTSQFWDGNPDDFFAYWDAYEMLKRDESIEKNINNYNLAKYIMLAVAQNLQFSKNPKKIFPKEPFKLASQKSKMTNKEYEELRKIKLKSMCDNLNKNKKK